MDTYLNTHLNTHLNINIKNINWNLIGIIFYLAIILNFGTGLLFIPMILIHSYFPSYVNIKYLIKNIAISSICYIFLTFSNTSIYVNSSKLFEQMIKTNSNFNPDEKKIITSNHLTEIDFLVGMCLFGCSDFFSRISVVAKKSLGYILSSLSMIGILTGDIYLNRNIELDKLKLSSQMNFTNLLMFPEGTCFTKEKKLLSDNYCDSYNLIKFKYNLYPRTTGLKHILANNPDIKYLYDLTIIYDTIPPNKYGPTYSMWEMIFKYKFPKKIFVNITKYKIDSNVDLNKQFESMYYAKDKLIENFNSELNNFTKIKFNYSYGLTSLGFVCFICAMSFEMFYHWDWYRNFLTIQSIVFTLYYSFYG